MDMNYNLNQSLNASLNLAGIPQQNSLNTTVTHQAPIANMATWAASYPNVQLQQQQQLQHQQQLQQLQLQQQQQQLQQINAQIASLGVTDNGTAYLDAYLQQGLPPPGPVAPTSPYFVSSVQESPRTETAPVFSNLGATFTPTLQSPTTPVNGNFNQFPVGTPGVIPIQAQVTFPNSDVGLNGQIVSQGVVYNAPLSGSTRINVEVPNSLPLHNRSQEPNPVAAYSSYSSSPTSSSPATPKKIEQKRNADLPTFYGSRPRQQMSAAPTPAPPGTRVSISDNSSTTSSTSVPSSPISTGHAQSDGNWSDASGPKSPEHQQVMNGDVRSPVSPIQNKPLLLQTRYPQDKCYSCMKKVYPMEKLGAVRGVVYHKGCFKCKVCSTRLTIKTFFHNQGDPFDLSVYCKSHQPLANDRGPRIDSESFQIKSALSAPKQGKVTTESDRAPVHKYNYDATSREIEHARKVPVVDLQAGNKFRNKAWTKSKRDHERLPPPDVVKHDDVLPEYDMDSYERHTVESNPDYS